MGGMTHWEIVLVVFYLPIWIAWFLVPAFRPELRRPAFIAAGLWAIVGALYYRCAIGLGVNW